MMSILLASPRGFCAGVDRAISIVQRALEVYGSSVYVRHEIVHNQYVVNTLRRQGAIFIKQIHEVPDKSILIFSAHGVSKAIRAEAYSRDLIIFDATCPLITKIHMKVTQASRKGIEVVLIGHSGHPEVEGVMGQYNNSSGGIYLVESVQDVWRLQVKNPNNMCYMTQTTLSISDAYNIINALRTRFPAIIGPRKEDDICYATINRQRAIRAITYDSDMVLVIGSQHSSNSNRLVELVEKIGKPAYLIDSAYDIKKIWLKGIKIIGVTSSASSPDILVKHVIERLRLLGVTYIKELICCEEKLIFKIPKDLC